MLADSRQALQIVLGIFHGLGTVVTPFIRCNFGVSGMGSSALVAFLIIVVYGASENAPEVTIYLVAWLVALAWRRSQGARNERNGRAEHSCYDGWPWLAMKIPFVRTEVTAKAIEPFLCIFGGAFICPLSEAIGRLVILSGFGLLISRIVALHAREARARRMRDAMIEMELINRDLRRLR